MEHGKFCKYADRSKNLLCNLEMTFYLLFRDRNANDGKDWHCDGDGRCLKNVNNLDILSAHFYGDGGANRLAATETHAYIAGKVFIVDEFGSY